MTIQEACVELDLDWVMLNKAMDMPKRKFILEVSMLANVREEYLSGDVI